MRSVRSLVAVAALTCGLGQAAFAADMPAPMTKAPPPAVVAALYNWTGLYIGANVGYGWGTARWSAPAFRNSIDGFAGGGQIGANFQAGQFVLGAEALWDFADISGRRTFAGAGWRNRVSSILLATGRAGYAWNNVLGYVKGGYAGASDRSASTIGGSARRWHSGWTVGAGFEYGFTPNLSLGLEYNYVDLSRARFPLGGLAGTWRVDPNIHLVLAKLNYRFNWGR
jgi:outer membrane immunogenic protein